MAGRRDREEASLFSTTVAVPRGGNRTGGDLLRQENSAGHESLRQRPPMTTATASAMLAASPLVWSLESVRLPGPRGAEPFRPYTYQAVLLSDRSQRRLVLKSRQTGITTAAAIEVAHEAIHRPRSLSLVISRDLVAAQNVIRTILEIFGELDMPPRLDKENQSEIVLENGSRIISQPATAKAGRGYTATSVVLDEHAFSEYAEPIYRATSPTLSRGGG